MKRTLLDYTQNILSALSGDEVNSISDTTESQQVAEIVRTAYFNIIARAELPEQKKLFQLDSSQNVLEPIMMFAPEGTKSIEWLKYFNADTQTNMYNYVTILPLQQYVDYVNGYNTSESNVETLQFTVNSETFLFNYRNDIAPRYCTVISDYYVIFDSYNIELEDTLQSTNTMCFGLTTPVFLMEDSFIPNLDEAQVPLLLNEAKSLAFLELKQLNHPKAEQEAKRQWNTLQKDKSIDNKPSYFDQLPNFGRNPGHHTGPRIKWC